MSLSKVDAEWYRESYPDVAQAGIDPLQHYLQYGCAEGRFPRPLQSLMLERALWGGFSQRALVELRSLYGSTVDADERSYAAWALARWYACNHAWDDALHFIEILKAPRPSFLDHPGVVLLGVEILLRTQHIEDARYWIRSAMAERPGLPDWALTAANVGLPRHEPYTNQDDLRLAWLNSVWQSVGLSAIRKSGLNTSLSLDSLRPIYHCSQPPFQKVKISVLMPAFNASRWIGAALQGLLDQTWKNLEIIVIDDASTDDTAKQVRALASRDARIILLQQPENQGAYAARNLGMQRASGEFITNHDSDDWSHPERLEKMIQPLLDDRRLVATMADWVRVDNNLHFQSWRVEKRLIEPSVATLMCRKRAMEELGGWDAVRVAADCELYQRLQRAYGKHSIKQVMSGIPMILARQLPNSLTTATSSHLRTMFFGARRLYQELFEAWHSSATRFHDLCLSPSQRAFPAPKSLLHKTAKNPQYDWVIMADLSAAGQARDVTLQVIQHGLAADKRLALFHWPAFYKLAPTDCIYLTHALEGRIEIILSEDEVDTKHLFIVNSELLAIPPDRLPRIHFDRFRVISLNQNSTLEDILKCEDKSISGTRSGFPSQPKEFDSAWYLYRNPDVKAAGIDPWHHYVEHGAAEGREPSPKFNTPHYIQQCLEVERNQWPPLMHYLKIGKALGYDPYHPVIEGSQPPLEGRPTVLLCGHAAGQNLFGAERSFLDVVEACNALSMNVLVSLPSTVNATYINALQKKTQKIFCVPTTIWQANIPPCSYATKRLLEIICRERVDIVQANTIMLREPLIAARQANVRSFVHAHEVAQYDSELCNTIGLDSEVIRQDVVQRADCLLANSAFTAKHYKHKRSAIVAGGVVDPRDFSMPNVLSTEQITVGMISSNLPKKGLADFCKLACLVSNANNSIKMCLIGPQNTHTESIKNAVKSGALPANIFFSDYVATPAAAISQCSVVVVLSHCMETFGRTALEAMAAGRPVISYRTGALPEIIQDTIDGFLFSFGDLSSMALKIIELEKNRDLLRAIGEAGRRSAQSYSMRRLCEQLRGAYGIL